MGYNVYMNGGMFGIPAKHIDSALNAVCKAIPTYEQDSIESIKDEIEDFDFLPSTSKLRHLVHKGWGFKLRVDGVGDVVGVNWEWEKLQSSIVNWLHAVAPFVPAGCYVEMLGEDGERWRYVFDGEKMTEKYPKIVWE